MKTSVDPLEVYKLRLQHRLSFSQIGQLTGTTRGNAHATFRSFLEKLGGAQDVESYENARIQLLASVEEKLLATLLDEEKLQKASLNNVGYAFTQIHQALRLEKNQSTNNLGIATRIIESADRKLYRTPQQVVVDKDIENVHREVKGDGNASSEDNQQVSES